MLAGQLDCRRMREADWNGTPDGISNQSDYEGVVMAKSNANTASGKSKECFDCKQFLHVGSFNKDKSKPDGLCVRCRECRKLQRKRYRATTAKYNAKYQAENADKLKEKDARWYRDNAEYKKNYRKEHYQSKTNQCQNASKRWRQNNPERVRAQKRDYFNRTKDVLQVKLSHRLRNRLLKALRNGAKTGSGVRDLGCTLEEFQVYIEGKFSPGMTWANWSHKGWHLDHIQPLASFDLTVREQYLHAAHYTNYQPLWAKDNLSKGARVDGDIAA